MRPLIRIAVLPANTTRREGVIELICARTVSVTVMCTYNANATQPLKLLGYYSPDKTHFDTISYCSFYVNLIAGETVQETHILDVPESGHLQLALSNLDEVFEITNISVWVNTTGWGEEYR